jgi:hypothetical protein
MGATSLPGCQLESTPGVVSHRAFRVGPTRAGDYVVVAVGRAGAMPQPRDRSRFAQLIAAGERVTLGENEERVLDLTVVKNDR